LPLLALHPKINFDDPNWQAPEGQADFGYRFLYSNEADHLLTWGRLPAVAIAVLLGFFIFLWARQLYGDAGGLFSLALYAFCPNIIAHAHLVTMDVGVSAFLTISFYFLWRHGRDKKRFWFYLSSLAMGAALATKFSSIIMLPVALTILWLTCELGAPGDPSSDAKPAHRTGSRASKGGSHTEDSPWFALRRTIFQDARAKMIWGAVFVLLAFASVQIAYLGSLDLSLFWRGLHQLKKSHPPGGYLYFHGTLQVGHDWYYALAGFLVKATAPFVILILLRFIFLLRDWRSSQEAVLFLAFPVVFYSTCLALIADPLGVRYMIPAFPFLIIFAGGLVPDLARHTALLGTLVILLVWHVTSSVARFPHSLSYFNEFVGGPAHGMDWLDDSNVDWGQEIKALKQFMDRHQITKITLFSFSPYDNPEYYGINCDRPSLEEWARIIASPRLAPGVYVVSARTLARQKALGVDWMSRYPVIGNLGYSMYVFRVP